MTKFAAGDVESGLVQAEESLNPTALAFSSILVRTRFIRKVYAILTMQLGFTFVLCGLFVYL